MADHAHNLKASHVRGRPFGVITRGTTGVNRLRRSDRWSIHHPEITALLRAKQRPLVVDVGYGASHTTTVEWASRLRKVHKDIEVVGLEINPERVLPTQNGVRFELGGFELAGYQPHLVRAFNVLRQYDVDQVLQAWQSVQSRLAPDGFFIEGTCDELGRRAAWVLLDAHGPKTLTLAWDPWDIDLPSDLAERLPKALIHLNTPGNRIHELLRTVDDAWQRSRAWAPYGPRVQWEKTRLLLLDEGVEIKPQRRRLRDCLLEVDWSVVAP